MKIAQLEASLAEAVEDASTLRTHAANLLSALEALKAVCHDALDRDEFYAVVNFADTASFAKYLSRSLNRQADDAEAGVSDESVEPTAEVSTAAEAVLPVLKMYAWARSIKVALEMVQEEKFASLIIGRIAKRTDDLNTVEALASAVAEEKATIERSLIEKRGGSVAPKGNPVAEEKAELTAEQKAHLRLLDQLKSKAER